MIASFVTSHGFGHLNRSAAVLNRIPKSIPITIFCKPDLFDHWRERLERPASFQPHVCDAGAYNPPGDSQTTDGLRTIEAAIAARAEALARFDRDLALVGSVAPKVILSDAASLPLTYARRLGVPGYLLANFTWADIYRPHAAKLGAEARDLVRGLGSEYAQATAILRTEPALRMTRYWAPVIDVGMVGSRGRSRPSELRKQFDIPSKATLVYSYLGRYGQSGMDWDRLAELGRRGYHFIGFHPAPVGPLPNLHVVDPTKWTGADLAASCEIMAAKAGYGTVVEALSHRRPMIYTHRTGFAEHRALDRGLKAAGLAFPSTVERFRKLAVEPLLARALTAEPGPCPFPVDGAERTARILVDACRASRNRVAL